jgi:hypothetical protein
VIPRHHVKELAGFFAAHDQWLFGHGCVRTQGDRDLAADLSAGQLPGKGYPFASYATWWVRQAITRALAGTVQTARIPERTAAAIAQILIAQRRLARELGREPTPEELAGRVGP